MLQYSLGKNKTSEMPSSGAREIHKSSAQKQEGRNDAYSTRARSARKEKKHNNYRYKIIKNLSYNIELFHYPRI